MFKPHTVLALQKAFGDDRFTVQRYWREARLAGRYSTPYPMPEDAEWFERGMANLCDRKFALSTPGPRGGEGWKLTPAGVKYALDYEQREKVKADCERTKRVAAEKARKDAEIQRAIELLRRNGYTVLAPKVTEGGEAVGATA
jgi:hypothetical protein